MMVKHDIYSTLKQQNLTSKERQEYFQVKQKIYYTLYQFMEQGYSKVTFICLPEKHNSHITKFLNFNWLYHKIAC